MISRRGIFRGRWRRWSEDGRIINSRFERVLDVGGFDEVRSLVSTRRLYLDTNVELFKDITPLFRRTVREKKEVFMVADPGDSRFYSAGIFGAPTPGAQVFEKMLNSTNYLRGIDFGKRCIANAITGPVWLSHVIRANTLDETILRFDRDVAYPLGSRE